MKETEPPYEQDGDKEMPSPNSGSSDSLKKEEHEKIFKEDIEAGADQPTNGEVVCLAGPFSTAINIFKSIIGAGMLSLPFAMSLLGIIPGLILCSLAAFMSGVGLYLLAKASHQECGRDASYAALSALTYPKIGPLFDGAIAVKCMGVCIGYLKIIGDLMPTTIAGILGREEPTKGAWWSNRLVWVSAIVLAIAPVTYMKRMDSLKYTSFLGMLSVLYLIVLSVVMWVQTMLGTGKVFGWAKAFTSLSVGSFRGLPIMVFAFTCHQNNEAKDNSPRGMLRIINVCLIGSLIAYLIFATGSYATFNDEEINSNIINNYPINGVVFILARILYILLLTFTYPLVTFPSRTSLLRVYESCCPSLLSRFPAIFYYATTTGILLLTWLVACINPPLEFVLGLIGSTISPLICFFMPAIFWIKLDPSPSRRNPLQIVAWLLLGFAVISTAISLTSLIISMISKK